MTKWFISILVSSILLIVFLDKVSSQEETSSKTNREIRTVVIDAGHGGKDPGAISKSGIYEKNINLPIALKLRDLLQKEYDDLEIVMTRSDDRFIELHDRGRIANANGGNLFISIHSNSKKEDDFEHKTGFEIYLLDLVRKDKATEITQNENMFIQKNDSLSAPDFFAGALMESANLKIAHRFANILKTEMSKGTEMMNRGVKQDAFVVLYGASMPAILVECGFLTNEDDVKYLTSERGQNDIAVAIYKAVRLFKFDYDYENSRY